MLEKYHKLHPKPRTIDELKAVLQTILEDLPQEHGRPQALAGGLPLWKNVVKCFV